MANLNTSEALRAAVGSLPTHKLAKDRTEVPRCPLCLQVLEEGGGLEGGGVLGGMEWSDEIGEDGDPSLHTGRPTKTPRRVAVILEALRQYPLLNRAARLGGIKPRTLQRWRHDDAELRAAVEDAIDEGVERLELRAHEDAVHGTDREATLQRMFTIKRWRPEYRDNVTVHHQGGGQDARDAALLRRAMVEALGPFPEARAALAATLARLGGVSSDREGAPRALGPGSSSGTGGQAEEVVDAELVGDGPAAGGGGGSQAAGGGLESAGEEERNPGVDAGAGDPRPASGPVLSRSPSTPPNKGVLSFDNAVVGTHSGGDDPGSSDSHSGG